MRVRTGIVSLGGVLLAVFVVAVVLTGDKIGDLGDRLTVMNMRETCRHRASDIMYEFRKTKELQFIVKEFFREDDVYEEKDLLSFVKTLRQADAKLSRIWFFEMETDSLFVLNNEGGEGHYEPLSAAQWPHLCYMLDSITDRQWGGMFKADGEFFWTTIERVTLNSGNHVFWGFDISLADLHTYLAEWREPVDSYVFILNGDGVLLSHPDEKFLGRKLLDGGEVETMQDKLQKQGELDTTVYSEFLECPVYRVYYPFVLGQERWLIAVNIPQFATQEILADFHRYIVLIAVLTIIIFCVLLFYAQWRWRKENRLRRKVEQESVELRLQQLKNQLNPHFLFNSLNSLSALIGKNTALAKEFVLKLSKVYRYLLEKRSTSLAAVRDELDFTSQYYFLQRIRFGEHLLLDMQVDDACMDKKIPAMSLQTLVENAIKHNQITQMKPLSIRIFVQGDALIVENNYQPRGEGDAASMGIGFERITKIYEFYSSVHFEYGRVEGVFRCKLPFLVGGL